MSETPFRVEPTMHGNFGVADPQGRYFYTRSNKGDANAACHDLNAAWSAAGGPALTRQRDEAVALLRDIPHETCAESSHGDECSDGAPCPCCERNMNRDFFLAALREQGVPHAK